MTSDARPVRRAAAAVLTLAFLVCAVPAGAAPGEPAGTRMAPPPLAIVRQREGLAPAAWRATMDGVGPVMDRAAAQAAQGVRVLGGLNGRDRAVVAGDLVFAGLLLVAGILWLRRIGGRARPAGEDPTAEEVPTDEAELFGLIRGGCLGTLPWLWAILVSGICTLVFYQIMPPEFHALDTLLQALGILLVVPFIIMAVITACRPLLAHFRGIDPDLDPLAPLRLRRFAWFRDVLLVVIAASGMLGAGMVLGLPDAFLSNLTTAVVLAAAVYAGFLRLPGSAAAGSPGYRQVRLSIVVTKTVIIVAALVALAGFATLAFRLVWLFLAVLILDDLYRIIQALLGQGLIAPILPGGGPADGTAAVTVTGRFTSQRSMTDIQREKALRSFHAFVKSLFVIGSAYALVLILGVTDEWLGGVVNYAFFSIGAFHLTLAGLIKAYLTVTGATLVGRFVKVALIAQVQPRSTLDAGTTQALSNALFLLIVLAGYISALAVLGVNLVGLSIIGGGLAVGIGFGLQNITNNLISGVILFFERPINVGDVIDVKGTLGTVQQIGLRSTVVTTFDNITLIVPNASFIADTVVNWSWGDISIRLDVPVSVAYASDIDQVKRVLLEIAGAHRSVKRQPPPEVLFKALGGSALEFTLRVWLRDLRERMVVLSDINFAIIRRFRAEAIEIPFPRHDITIRPLPAGPDPVRPEGPRPPAAG
ncbi:MAG: mechanosensitive ion channel domain-containing protein [Planctomycetota bacterium]